MADLTPSRTTLPAFALSPGQRWRLSLFEEGDGPHLAQAAIGIDGPLDVERLGRALTKLVDVHEILRTVVECPAGGEGPRQLVLPSSPVHFSVGDSSNEPLDVASLFAREAAHHSDRSSEVPFTASLVQLEPGSWVLLLNGSVLCLDAASMDILLRQIALAYGQQDPDRSQAEPQVADVLQYADVAEWENELSESEDGGPGRNFWCGRNWPPTYATSLPFENSAPRQGASASTSFDAALGSGDTKGLRELVQALGASAEVVLLACHFVLLWRFTNRAPVVVGVRSDGRGYEALKDGIGPYARDLPVHVPLTAETTFESLVQQLDEELARAREWEHLFDWDVVAPGLKRDDGVPGLPFRFRFSRMPVPEGVDDLTFEMLAREDSGRGDSILFSTCDCSGDVHLVTHYDGGRFDEEYIASLTRSLRSILASAADDPSTRISRLSLLDPRDQNRLVVELNDTVRDYPHDQLIHEFMERQAALHPDRAAVEFEGRSLTYKELDERANRLANYLREAGVGPDTLVAIFAERSFDMVVAAFGVLKAGGGYVPLSPSYPSERLSFILDETRAPVLITTEGLAPSLPEHPARVIRLDTNWPEIAKRSDAAPERAATADNLAYVIYTSGSTGEPKGVVVTHRTFVISNEARIEFYGDSVDKFLLLSPFAFDSSIVGIFWTLSVGGTLSLITEDVQRDMSQLCEHVRSERVSHLLTLPSFYNVLLTHGEAAKLDGLHTVIVAGEVCPKEMVDRHKSELPRTRLYSEYGATETTIWSSGYDCLEQTIDTAPLGRPISNCEMYILDCDLEPLPVGVPGEVHFGGEILARGYWNRPDLTAERFIPNPFRDQPTARLYKSGDLARFLPNGDMEFLGRLDNQVKIRGFRIELEEIEIALVGHADLVEVAVAARDASEWDTPEGEGVVETGAKRLVAYVCPKEEPGPSAGELRDYLGKRLPSYMVPVAFMTLDELPTTPNGKLDRAALPRVGASGFERPVSPGAAPSSPTEVALAEIWKRVLGVAHVNREDNFFELGGDSILSIQVVALANKQGLGISPRDVFEKQTIAGLADGAGMGREVDADQERITGEAPLHPIQRWFFEQDRPAPHHANMAIMLIVVEPLDTEAMGRVVVRVTEHHDALRLRFQRSNGSWQQSYSSGPPHNAFSAVDLSNLTPRQQTKELEARARAMQRALNLETGDLLRVVYFDLGRVASPRLLVVVHHLVFDGVSLRVLLEDLQDGYREASSGREVHFPLKTTSYKSWNETLVEHARSEELRGELDFWLGVTPADSWMLPEDGESGTTSNKFADQRVLTRSLPEGSTTRLLKEVPNAYQSRIDDVLLTALVQSVCEWTGHSGLYLELEGHGREPISDALDASRTIGWFTTVYPAYLTVTPSEKPEEALRSIMAQLRAIPRKGVGYGMLRYLADDATRARLAAFPRPQVNFNYLGQFDQVLGGSAMFCLAPESTGPDFSEEAERPHLLEVVGAVVEGRLEVKWMYNQHIHASGTIERIADGFMMRLQALVDHCVAVGSDGMTSDGLTLADFEDFAWDQSDLEEIAGAVQRARGGK